MAETTIEWTRGPNGEPGYTFNPWIGCTKVSPGCDHCYAARQDAHRRWTPEGWGGPRRRTKTWGDPVKWNAQAEREGRRYRVFCASLADVFDNQVPDEWRRDLFKLIDECRRLDWLLLTKRIGNAHAMLDQVMECRWDGARWSHVWLGATVVNREEMLRDGPKLRAVPARVHFWSVEPMLGDLGVIPRELMPEWVIAGGESGPRARPAHPEWFRSLRDQCAAAGVPFLFKQWGEWVPYEHSAQPPFLWSQHGHEIDGHALPDFESEDGRVQREWHCDFSDMLLARRVGKKAAGRLLDGVEHNGFPA